MFDDEVRHFVRPSTRQGQLHAPAACDRRSHGSANAPITRIPSAHLQEFLRRRGMVALISDFWEKPETIIKTVEPLRFTGNELVLFHVLDPEEIHPKLKHPVLI